MYRFNSLNGEQPKWQISKDDTHILGNFQKLATASPNFETLHFKNLNGEELYNVHSVNQTMPISQFGHLISHALPIKIHPDGFLMRLISKYKQLDNATESYQASGQMLMNGIKIKQQFMGTYYNDQTRLLGDFGSQIYFVEKQKN
jgi:alpha-galactosidase